MNLASLIALSELPRYLPVAPNGKPYARSTVHRWTTVGIRNQKLKYIQVGGRRYVDPVELHEFFERLRNPVADRTSQKEVSGLSIADAAAAGARLKAKYFARRTQKSQ